MARAHVPLGMSRCAIALVDLSRALDGRRACELARALASHGPKLHLVVLASAVASLVPHAGEMRAWGPDGESKPYVGDDSGAQFTVHVLCLDGIDAVHGAVYGAARGDAAERDDATTLGARHASTVALCARLFDSLGIALVHCVHLSSDALVCIEAAALAGPAVAVAASDAAIDALERCPLARARGALALFASAGVVTSSRDALTRLRALYPELAARVRSAVVAVGVDAQSARVVPRAARGSALGHHTGADERTQAHAIGARPRSALGQLTGVAWDDEQTIVLAHILAEDSASDGTRAAAALIAAMPGITAACERVQLIIAGGTERDVAALTDLVHALASGSRAKVDALVVSRAAGASVGTVRTAGSGLGGISGNSSVGGAGGAGGGGSGGGGGGGGGSGDDEMLGWPEVCAYLDSDEGAPVVLGARWLGAHVHFVPLDDEPARQALFNATDLIMLPSDVRTWAQALAAGAVPVVRAAPQWTDPLAALVAVLERATVNRLRIPAHPALCVLSLVESVCYLAALGVAVLADARPRLHAAAAELHDWRSRARELLVAHSVFLGANDK